MVKKQLMIGICKASKQLIDDARRRGVYTIIAGPESEGRTAASVGADEYWNIDTSNIDELENKCRSEGVDAVINGISTYNITVCIELSKRLGLPCYASSESWYYTIDKFAFKKLCRETGVPVAKDYYVSDPPTEEELDSIEFPVVVKAVDLSANRGMSYCSHRSEIAPACEYARSLSQRPEIVIEKKMEGREYAAHYAIAEGEARLINFDCMLSQPGYPGNCYSITSTETDRLQVFLEEVHPHLLKFIKAAGIREGVCWFEMMADTDEHLYALEMGYRMSGELFAVPMRNVCGFDEYSWLNDISLGIRHTVKDLPENEDSLPEKVGTSYIIWSNEKSGVISRLDGIDKISEMKGIEVDNIMHVGSRFNPYQYLVVILIESQDVNELIEQIKMINQTVKIENEHGENIAIYYNDFNTLLKLSREGRNSSKERG